MNLACEFCTERKKFAAWCAVCFLNVAACNIGWADFSLINTCLLPVCWKNKKPTKHLTSEHLLQHVSLHSNPGQEASDYRASATTLHCITAWTGTIWLQGICCNTSLHSNPGQEASDYRASATTLHCIATLDRKHPTTGYLLQHCSLDRKHLTTWNLLERCSSHNSPGQEAPPWSWAAAY